MRNLRAAVYEGMIPNFQGLSDSSLGTLVLVFFETLTHWRQMRWLHFPSRTRIFTTFRTGLVRTSYGFPAATKWQKRGTINSRRSAARFGTSHLIRAARDELSATRALPGRLPTTPPIVRRW